MSEMKPSERICAALDFGSWREAEPFARAIAPAVGMLKVGLELFVAEGPPAVRAAAALGRPVFLDLKLHDIPNTVEGAARSAAASGASLLTVHASGGPAMVRAAVKGAGGKVRVLAVTVLTSLDDAAVGDLGFRGPAGEAALRLARLSWRSGVRGFVCSPRELRAFRQELGPEAVLVTPGIRGAGQAAGDQARTATASEAAAAGASYLVVGRPIRDAADPRAAAAALAREIDAGD